MKRRIISVIVCAAMLFANAGIASAFISDVKNPGVTGIADLSSESPTATLTVAVKNVADLSAATDISWLAADVNLGDGWKVSKQCLQLTYNANRLGWGVQVYTDNMGVGANPSYTGDPMTDPAQQPGGLLGVGEPLLTCPIAILTLDASATLAQLQTPVEVTVGQPGDINYSIYFNTGRDLDTQKAGSERAWIWLTDKSGTKWIDNNPDNNEVDPGEITGSFINGGEYATVVDAFGNTTGWKVDPNDPADDAMFRNNEALSPIFVYFAAKFTKATVIQEYKTNTITVELYHE